MDKDELLERYEALGENEDFLAAKLLFEAEIRRQEQSGHGATSWTMPPSAAGN